MHIHLPEGVTLDYLLEEAKEWRPNGRRFFLAGSRVFPPPYDQFITEISDIDVFIEDPTTSSNVTKFILTNGTRISLNAMPLLSQQHENLPYVDLLTKRYNPGKEVLIRHQILRKKFYTYMTRQTEPFTCRYCGKLFDIFGGCAIRINALYPAISGVIYVCDSCKEKIIPEHI